MKLLLLITASFICGYCFSQQLKPEIKELMKTDLKPPKSLIYEQTYPPKYLIDVVMPKQRDTLPKLSPQELQKLLMLQKPNAVLKPMIINPQNKNSLKYKLPGVYSLKLDNMPCIVPNTKDIAKIPNLWPGAVTVPFRGRIPNPSLPQVQASPETK